MGSPADAAHFDALRHVFRQTGGIARGDDLGRLLEDRHSGDFVTLARFIAAGEVFGFEWRAMFWVPMFQFELRDLTLKYGARSVLSELSPVFDGWRLSVWFAEPNSWLADRIPVDLLDHDLRAVRDAARADRFVATG